MGLCGKTNAHQAQPAAEQPWKDAYEVIKMPQLPDLSRSPWGKELQVFREQCATGVRQAVAMVTAMEQQLYTERARRQQAEEDVKVLLAAIEAERHLSGSTLQDMRALKDAQGDALTLRADQLTDASKAATVIQKNFRGHAARKEFEEHLKGILRGVDPELDPSTLPAVAQHHVSNVNMTTKGKGLKATLQGMNLTTPLLISGNAATANLSNEVQAIQKRIESLQDAGQGPDSALDTTLDIKRILQGDLPASSATVIAALVRRCKELQAALIEATESLQQARVAEQGLRAENTRVIELSQVRTELLQERSARQGLQQTVAKLQHALTAQLDASLGRSTVQSNPHIAAWYRTQCAKEEHVPWAYDSRRGTISQGHRLFAGNEAEVETWDDLRASIPEPILLPKPHPSQRYNDLLSLTNDMATGVEKTLPSPLYYSDTPDTTQFSYPRDTPIVPTQTPLQLIREGGTGTQGVDGLARYDITQPPLPPGTPPPVVPMYSVLPLIREGDQVAQAPPVHYTQQPSSYHAPAHPHSTPMTPPPPPQQSHGPAQSFSYQRDTPNLTVNSALPLLREGGNANVSGSGGDFTFSSTMGGNAAGTPRMSAAGPAAAPQMSVLSPLSLLREGTHPQPR